MSIYELGLVLHKCPLYNKHIKQKTEREDADYMEFDDRRILEWTINKIKTEHLHDVALLIGHGFGTDGNQDQYKGEIDYFIPDNARANSLSRTFIVGEVCYDIYPRTWDSIATMAELNDCHTGCLADANILYARSDADREKFESMRAKLFQNMRDDALTKAKAMERLTIAKEIYAGAIFCQKLYEVRAAAGSILDYLAQSIALYNGRYFHRNALYQLEEMKDFQHKPVQFETLYEQMVLCGSMNEIKRLCYRLIVLTSEFLKPVKEQKSTVCTTDFRELANWYQEFGHMWRKIYDGCKTNDVRRVFAWGCALQHELDVICEEFFMPEMDLLGCYQADNFEPLAKQAKQIEDSIIRTIIQNSIRIAIYPTVQDFLEKN